MKKCIACKVIKESTQFNQHQSYCKPCDNERSRLRRLKNKQYHQNAIINLSGRKKCTSCKQHLSKTKFSPNLSELHGLNFICKDCTTIRQLKYISKKKGYAFNVPSNWTGVNLRKLRRRQNSRCALCNKKELGRFLHLDHDHKTGTIRGYVCGNCNRTLIPVLEQYPEVQDMYFSWKSYFSQKNFIELF